MILTIVVKKFTSNYKKIENRNSIIRNSIIRNNKGKQKKKRLKLQEIKSRAFTAVLNFSVLKVL